MPHAADARSIDVGRVTRQYLFLGALVPLALGAVGLLAAVTGAGVSGGAGVRAGAGVIGTIFLLLAGGVYWLLAFHPPQSWLDVSPAGLTWRTRRELTLAWEEIGELALVRSRTTFDTRSTVRAPILLPSLGRRYLRITVTSAAARRPDVRAVLGGEQQARRAIHLDLGVRRAVAREVGAALGGRLSEPAGRVEDPS